MANPSNVCQVAFPPSAVMNLSIHRVLVNWCSPITMKAFLTGRQGRRIRLLPLASVTYGTEIRTTMSGTLLIPILLSAMLLSHALRRVDSAIIEGRQCA